MKKSLIKILACPSCCGPLHIDSTEGAGEIKEGMLLCKCGKQCHIHNYIPRFVADDSYVKSFSMEWKLHAKTQLDSETSKLSERAFKNKTGLTEGDVKGKLVLDVGCGMGRYTDIVEKWGGEVVGFDLSYSVNTAYANLGHKPRVNILQADVFNLPFKKGVFDIIFSIGVLQHTADCRKAFLELPQYLKRKGVLCITVYSNYKKIRTFMTDMMRIITTRLPKRLLYFLCMIAVPLYYVYKIPLLGSLLGQFFPISMHPSPQWRILDTFNWYAPKYQSKHSYPEVYGWFKAAGLENIELLEPPIAMRATKP